MSGRLAVGLKLAPAAFTNMEWYARILAHQNRRKTEHQRPCSILIDCFACDWL